MSFQVHFTGFEQKVLFNGRPFTAAIFDGVGLPPEGFNALVLRLDASEKSLLDWKTQCEMAHMAVVRGLYILWELEFDLSGGSLEDEARFLALQLNVLHFDASIWAKFEKSSLGVGLFRGKLRPDLLEYLKSLAVSLSDTTSCFLFLETQSAHSAADYFAIVDQKKMGHFHFFLKGPFAEKYPLAMPALGWGHGASSLGYCSETPQILLPETRIRVAICLPEHPNAPLLQRSIDALGAQPFRVIPESLVTHEWEGIDELLVLTEHLSEQTKRTLCGFEAAGGRVHDSSYAANCPMEA